MSSKPEIAAPLAAADSGRLEFARGASRVTIDADRDLPDLFRASFQGPVPMLLTRDGRVTIEYPRLSPSTWLRPDRRSAEVSLNASIPWELVFGGGVSRLRADLGELTLLGVEISHGASDVELVLPAPRGIVPVRVGGGASKVVLRRPAGVAATLSIAGGAAGLSFDRQHLGAIGGETRLESPLAGETPDRYEVEIGGGASELLIGEVDARALRPVR
jgi:hypothetical protein